MTSCFAQTPLYSGKSKSEATSIESRQRIFGFLGDMDFVLKAKFPLPIQYDPPSLQQMLLVKDSLGSDAYQLLHDQRRMFNLFQHGKELVKQLEKMNLMGRIIKCSEDYKVNKYYLDLFGGEWTRLHFQDSLLVNNHLEGQSQAIEAIRMMYGTFHLNYRSLSQNPNISALKNYEYEGSTRRQKKYFNEVIEIHKSNMPPLASLATDFVEKSYESFNEVYEILNARFPTYKKYLTP